VRGGGVMKERFNAEVKDVPGKEGVKIVELEGEIDISNSQKILDIMLPLIEEGNKFFIIDFSQLKHINSSGMFNFLRCFSKLKEKGGWLRFVNIGKAIREVLDSLGITRVFTIYGSVEEALREE